jgi:hypothetical protein
MYGALAIVSALVDTVDGGIFSRVTQLAVKSGRRMKIR